MLKALDTLPEELGKPEVLLVDNGYFSQTNVEACGQTTTLPRLLLRVANGIPCRYRSAWLWIQRLRKPPIRWFAWFMNSKPAEGENDTIIFEPIKIKTDRSLSVKKTFSCQFPRCVM